MKGEVWENKIKASQSTGAAARHWVKKVPRPHGGYTQRPDYQHLPGAWDEGVGTCVSGMCHQRKHTSSSLSVFLSFFLSLPFHFPWSYIVGHQQFACPIGQWTTVWWLCVCVWGVIRGINGNGKKYNKTNLKNKIRKLHLYTTRQLKVHDFILSLVCCCLMYKAIITPICCPSWPANSWKYIILTWRSLSVSSVSWQGTRIPSNLLVQRLSNSDWTPPRSPC